MFKTGRWSSLMRHIKTDWRRRPVWLADLHLLHGEGIADDLPAVLRTALQAGVLGEPLQVIAFIGQHAATAIRVSSRGGPGGKPVWTQPRSIRARSGGRRPFPSRNVMTRARNSSSRGLRLTSGST